MWSYLFGGGANSKDAPKKAIVGLREQINMLNKKHDHLEKQASEQEALARKLISSDKVKAKNALKRKKVYEGEAEKIRNQMDGLENQLRSIENANLNLETMKAMKAGAKAMKQIHGGITVDKVDETMEDIREQAELSEEISEAISRAYPVDTVDEDELEDELEQLQQEEVDNKLLNSGTKTSVPQVHMPSVPSTSLKTGKEEEEEEDEDEAALKQLQAEMGL